MLELLGRAGCVSIGAGVETLTVEGRNLRDKGSRLTTRRHSQLLYSPFSTWRMNWLRARGAGCRSRQPKPLQGIRHNVCGLNQDMAKARRKSENSIAEMSASPAADTATATIDRQRVALRAYEIYLSRGCGDGRDLDDWLSAERELTASDRTEEGSSSRDDEL